MQDSHCSFTDLLVFQEVMLQAVLSCCSNDSVAAVRLHPLLQLLHVKEHAYSK